MPSQGNGDKSGVNQHTLNRCNILLGSTTLAAASAITATQSIQVAQAQQQQQPTAPSGKKPNILVIFGDDIGQSNLSAYTFGLTGHRTPNIDRIAREGLMFTDYYAEQSCTAGRSSFITGQSVIPDNEYADGMIEHDGDVGKLLKTLDDLDVADDTIVLYTTDNGPHMNSWPDAAMRPFRSEKDTNREGAFRVPAMIRWLDKALDEATAKGWTITDMKKDWNVIFPFEMK